MPKFSSMDALSEGGKGERLLSEEKEKEKHDQKAPEDVADWKWETTRLR